MRICAVLVLFLSSFLAFGQFDQNYTPVPVIDTIPGSLVLNFKQKLAQDKASIINPKSKEGVFLASLYEKRYEYLTQTFNDDLFIIDNDFSPYLQSILEVIKDANPQLRGD